MSTASSHIVGNLNLDFRYQSLKDARWGNDKLEEIFYNRLNQIIENEVDKVFSGQLNFELDELQIDLGKISKYDFENSLGELIQKELSEKLRSFLNSKRSFGFAGQSSGNIERKHFLIDALSTYLQKGYFPSWLDKNYTHEILFNQLIESHTEGLKKMILVQGEKSERVRKRLAFNFSDHQINLLIRVLEPNEADWVILYKKDIKKPDLKKAKGEKEIVLSDQILNFFILNFLLQKNGSRFNRIAFSKTILEQIAAHYNLDFFSLIERLFKVVDQVKLKSLLLVELKETLSIIKDQNIKLKETSSDFNKIKKLRSPWKSLLKSKGLREIESVRNWTLLTQSERLNILIKKDPDFVSKLSAGNLDDLISILAGSNKEIWNELITGFWEEYSKKIGGYSSKNEFLKKVLLAFSKLSNNSHADKTQLLIDAIIDELCLDSELGKGKKIILQKALKVHKSLGDLLFQINKPKNLFKYQFISEPYDVSNIDFDTIVKENYGKAIVKFLETGVLEKPDQLLNLGDLQIGFAKLIEGNSCSIHPFFKDFKKNSHLVNLRLIQLMKGLKTDSLFEFLGRLNPELAPFFKLKKGQSLFSQDNLKSQDEQELIHLFTETSHLLSIKERIGDFGAESNNGILEAFQKLIALRKAKDSINWELTQKIFLSSANLRNQNRALQSFKTFLEIRKRRGIGLSLNSSVLRSFSRMVQKKGGLKLGLNLTSDFQLMRTVSQLSYLDAEITQKVFEEILVNDLQLGLRYLQNKSGRSTKLELKSKDVSRRVKYLFEQIKHHYSLKTLLIRKIKTQVIENANTFYSHLSLGQWHYLKSVFDIKYEFDFEIHVERGQEKDAIRIGFVSNTEFVKSMISLMRKKDYGKELVNQFIVVNELLTGNVQNEFVSKRKIRQLILQSIFYAIRNKEASGKLQFIQIWAKEFHNSLAGSISEELIFLEWKYRVERSTQLSSGIKEKLSKEFSVSSTFLNSEKSQNFLVWLEAYSFFKNKGYLPWWSPIKSLEKFFVSFFSLSDQMDPAILRQLDTLIDYNSLNRLFSKLTEGSQSLLCFQLQNSKNLRREITSINKLIAKNSEDKNGIESRSEILDKDVFDVQEDSRIKSQTSHSRKEYSLEKRVYNSLVQSGENYKTTIEYYLQRGKEQLILEAVFGKTEYYNFIKNLIRLAPKLYLKNLNPGKWKLLIFSFGWELLGQNHSRLGSKFYLLFFNYLKNKHASFDWKSIFYELLQNETYRNGIDKNLVNELEKFVGIKKNDKTEIEMINEGDQMVVSNAGIVLCWPFFNMLFTKLGWLNGIEFKTEEEQSKACLMFQFLAFGQTDFPEYEMVLNKVLAGMPIEQHLDITSTLTEEEKTMGLTMLEGFRANWDKVGNSTIEGIQESFLQRNGILETGLNVMILKVEHKTIDVLMDTIPWGMSMIKLPWMKKGLEINWR